MQYVDRHLFKGNHILRFLIALLALMVTSSVAGAAKAEGSGSSACAVTPNLLGGQGFSVSGQGFSVSGQGFSVSGQGFSVSGQGFSLSGQGIDPLAFAAEVRDNPVIPGKWVNDRLAFFRDAVGFNTNSTAILVVDEFNDPDAHGVHVQRVIDDSLTTLRQTIPNLRVAVFPVDISDATTNYNADVIASKITAKVNELRATYNRFVLNMSFGLISCTAPATNLGGQPIPAFDFNQAVDVVEANNADVPTLGITPIVDCVLITNNVYTAFFGYQNDNSQLVNIPLGANNSFSPNPADRKQPEFFEPGRQRQVFVAAFSPSGNPSTYPGVVASTGSSVTWSVRGPDGQVRTAIANTSTTPCLPQLALPVKQIKPVAECISDLGGGNYEARFGYINNNGVGFKIPVGVKNKFSPNPENRGQLTTFAIGEHKAVFTVAFTGSSLSWTLDGSTVTANTSLPACPEPEGFGVGDYLTQNMGVPKDSVDEYWQNLAGPVAQDEFQSLRTLLRGYLADSAIPARNFSLTAVASSGNFKPWLGAAPLAPASWSETIAVGATLDDSNVIWSFSQDANVVAPGVGYPLGNNTFGAGTSFAAPAFSLLAGLCSTTPQALKFDGTNPPLVPTAFANGAKILNNALVGLDSLAPLNCKPNHAPTITALPNRTDPEGTSVSFSAAGSDVDGDIVTFSATGLPPGITISSAGLISGLLNYTSAGVYTVTVSATDNGLPAGSAPTTFTWTVTDVPQVTNVSINIKPLSPFNRINLRSHGKVAVAILSSATFDATTVNPRTVTLAGAPVVIKFGVPLSLIIDTNGDRRRDLVVWVRVQDLQLTNTSTEAVLEGRTYANVAIRGVDSVTIVGPHAPHLLGPITNVTVRTPTFTLTWEAVDEEEEADNMCFQVQIDNNINFSSIDQSATVVMNQSVAVSGLPNGTYYWRVAMSDCASQTTSTWSDVWSFTIRPR